MKQLAWLTDIHLNFLELPALKAFMEMLASTTADAFVISGDIAESRDLVGHLQTIVERVKRPVYFVLGNHDFYRASITGVREKFESCTRSLRTSTGCRALAWSRSRRRRV